MPVVAVVLMLLTPRARAAALAFLLGWVVGIGALGTLVVLLAGPAVGSDEDVPTWSAVLHLVVGVLLLALAVRTWRGRPRGDAEPSTPSWMRAVEHVTPVRAFGLAVLLGAVNPKNLLLVVSGATTIAAATASTGAQLGALAVFVVVASLGVAAPVVAHVVAGPRAAAPLDELRAWMVRNNVTITSVLLLVLGTSVLGNGVAAL
jgi:threonine/homoserine/homoserine lactone efflux protein